MTTRTIWTTWLERIAAAKAEAKKTHTDRGERMQAERKAVEEIAEEVGGKQVMLAMMLGVLSHPDVEMEMKVEVARVWSEVGNHCLDADMRDLEQGSWVDAFGGMLDGGEEDVVVVGARAIGAGIKLGDASDIERFLLNDGSIRNKLARLLQSESAKKQDAAMVVVQCVSVYHVNQFRDEHGAVVESAIAGVMAQQQQRDDDGAVVMKRKKLAAKLVTRILEWSNRRAEFATSLHTNHGAAVRQDLVSMLETTITADTEEARFAAYQAIHLLSYWCDGFREALEAEHGDVMAGVLMQALEREGKRSYAAGVFIALTEHSKTFAEAVNKRHGVVLRKMLVERLEAAVKEKTWSDALEAEMIGWMAKHSVPFVIALEAEHYGKRLRAALAAKADKDENALAICELAEQSSMFAISLDEEHGVEVRQKLMKRLQDENNDCIPLHAVRAVGVMSRKAPRFGRAFLVEHLNVRERLEAVQHLEEVEEEVDDEEENRFRRDENAQRREIAVAAREAVAALEDAVAEGKDPMIKSAAKRAKTDEDF